MIERLVERAGRIVDTGIKLLVRSGVDRSLGPRSASATVLAAAVADRAGDARQLALPALLVAGVRAGFGAAVVMDLPMAIQKEGYTPAYVAAGVLQGQNPGEVSRVDATIAHHGAGALGGVLFALVYATLDAAAISIAESRIEGLSTPAYPIAVGFVVAFVYAFFARFVLVRFGGEARDRAGTVRRAWVVSTLVYGAVFAALVAREFPGGN
jgi:hypothetical protein